MSAQLTNMGGLTWNAALETGGILVSENIKLEFEISTIAAQ
jgi:hypothetical protein